MEIKKSPVTYVPNGQLTELFLPDFQWTAEGNGAHYLLVATDGHLEKMVRLYPDGAARELALGKKSEAHPPFPITSCAGKPVEYEIVSQVVGIYL